MDNATECGSEESFYGQFLQTGVLDQETYMIMDAIKCIIEETEIFLDDKQRTEALMRMTIYINDLSTKPTNDPAQPFRLHPVMRNIKCFMRFKRKDMLQAYVKTLYEKIMEPENRTRYEQWKKQFLDAYLPENDKVPDANLHQSANFNVACLAVALRNKTVTIAGHSVQWLLRNVLKVPQKLIHLHTTTGLDEALVTIGTNWTPFLTTMAACGGIASVITFHNLWRFHQGKQSLERTKKNLIDGISTVAVAGFVGWGVQALLAVVFPIGFWVGLGIQFGVGVAAGTVTNYLVSMFTTGYYNLPKSQALEDAYRKLGLAKNSSDAELNKRCRELSRKHHPDYLQRLDPGPDDNAINKAVTEFIEIQKAYKFIKTMRETERACMGHDENRDWKENFMLFVKNLVSLRREEYATEILEIDYQSTGLPPEEVLEECNFVNTDAPMRTVERKEVPHSVQQSWWRCFLQEYSRYL